MSVIRGAIIACAAALWVSAASAQAPVPEAQADESQAEQARRHFVDGMRALQEDRFHDAARELSRSHELLPNVANSFNLAVALLRIARAQEAIVLFRELEDERFGPIEDAQRRAIQARVEEAERALAILTVTISGAASGRVLVDDIEVGQTDGGEIRVSVDPGPRRVAAEAPDRAPASTTVVAESGETHHVDLMLEAIPADPPEPTGSVNHRRRRALWVSLVIVAVGGAGLALGLALRNRRADPIIDPVTGIGETLRAPAGFSF